VYSPGITAYCVRGSWRHLRLIAQALPRRAFSFFGAAAAPKSPGSALRRDAWPQGFQQIQQFVQVALASVDGEDHHIGIIIQIIEEIGPEDHVFSRSATIDGKDRAGIDDRFAHRRVTADERFYLCVVHAETYDSIWPDAKRF
jgi:hypothetical protein